MINNNNNQTTNNQQQQSLGAKGGCRLQDLPIWGKVVERYTSYITALGSKTIDAAFAVKGNRNGLPFSTQVLGNIRLVSSGSIAQSYQSWRAKHTTGDISEWIIANIYQLSPEELKAQKAKEQHDAEVLKTAQHLLKGMSLFGKPTHDLLEKAKSGVVEKFGDEVYTKLTELVVMESYGNLVKTPVIDSVQTVKVILQVMKEALETATFHFDKMESRMLPALLATDLADLLVENGTPFRDAHHIVGSLVGSAAKQGKEFTELSDEEWMNAGVQAPKAIKEKLTFLYSIERRNIEGGTGSNSLQEQFTKAENFLESLNF